MSCRYRHRMWCNCKKPAKPFPPVPVESVGIVGWDASGTQTFQAQDNPYYASFSIEVLPTDATNKMITITSSNTRVINWAVYDSTAVTFTIEGEGDAEVTITSQDNPEVSTTYSVTVTPPTPPFSPTNSILVEPTRGNAILKFFATDGESVDYVQARLGANNKLTYVTYYGACEGNEYCEEMFSNETIKEELGASIGNYIDEYGIPETGAMTFTDEMYSIIEDYFAGEANIEDIITEIETGDIVEPVEPESCPVRVNNVINSISLEEGAIDTVNFTVTYSCSHPDYSDLMAVSSNNSVAQVSLDAQHGVINVTGLSAGNCTITLTDFYDAHTISVTVTEPVPVSCPAYVSDIDTETITLTPGESYDLSYQDTYECGNPDYSAWAVSSSADYIAEATIDFEGYSITIVGGNEEGECVITFTDGANSYNISVVVGESSSGLTFYERHRDEIGDQTPRTNQGNEISTFMTSAEGPGYAVEFTEEDGNGKEIAFTVDGLDPYAVDIPISARGNDYGEEYSVFEYWENYNNDDEYIQGFQIDLSGTIQISNSINIIKINEDTSEEEIIGTISIQPIEEHIPYIMYFLEECYYDEESGYDICDSRYYSTTSALYEGEPGEYNVNPIEDIKLVTVGMDENERDELLTNITFEAIDLNDEPIEGVVCTIEEDVETGAYNIIIYTEGDVDLANVGWVRMYGEENHVIGGFAFEPYENEEAGEEAIEEVAE